MVRAWKRMSRKVGACLESGMRRSEEEACEIVIPMLDTRLRFECQMCGSCCSFGIKRLGIIPLELYPSEAVRLERLGYSSAYRTIGDRFFLKLRRGACFFLTENRVCSLRLKTRWTPVNCRLFPFTLHAGRGVYVLTVNWKYAARVGCRGFGHGPTVAERIGEYEKMGWEIDQLVRLRRP